MSILDVKRLESYAKNLVDYHVIVDLLPLVARLYFLRELPIHLSLGQAAILLGLGLQHRTMDDMENDLNLPANQLLALFNKAMRKVTKLFQSVEEHSVEADFAEKQKEGVAASAALPTAALQPLEEELRSEARKVHEKVESQKEQMLQELEHSAKYAVVGNEEEWQKAVADGTVPTVVSVSRGEKAKRPPSSGEGAHHHHAKKKRRTKE